MEGIKNNIILTTFMSIATFDDNPTSLNLLARKVMRGIYNNHYYSN